MAELKTSYPGGKAGSGVYQTLINQIPPHDTYISATAGHDAVLRYKVPAARNVAIDLDPEPLEWWSRDREDVELHNCDGIEWLRMNFGFYRLPDPDANSGGSRTTPSTTTQPGAASADSSENGGTAAPRVFALLDPPYPAAVRTSGKIYKFDQLGHEFHARMLETVKRLPIMVMVCCYPNANGLNASRRLSGKKSPISRLESELRFLPLLVKTKVNPILDKSIGQICHLL